MYQPCASREMWRTYRTAAGSLKFTFESLSTLLELEELSVSRMVNELWRERRTVFGQLLKVQVGGVWASRVHFVLWLCW